MIIALFVAVIAIPISVSILLVTIGFVSSFHWRSACGSEPRQRIVSCDVQAKKTRRRRSSASTPLETSIVKPAEPPSYITSASKSVEEKRTKPVNVVTKNIKKIPQTVSLLLKPKIDLASSFSKKAAHKISKSFTPKRVRSSTSSSLKPLRHLSSALTKSKKFSPALNMIREVSNGHCREIVLPEEALSMSRALSSNLTVCTGW
ncbi:hypothetical protein Moror_13072 [Moniliophthora roreri MCA 2997]|uniref:Uncharacterized protein n=2 Tax=Moniliophthora roreri TaxID=221103 RepID=V2XJB9_MONRO|nr:hypothetical protein Moror_13072 [Moniliophthora roreri MCA 2997]KAI3604281.1 hypothetical protein WG66_008475 [Moniliophthora roreri]